MRVGVIGAGNVLWAYLQILDRLIPHGLAEEGSICARRRDMRPAILGRRPGATLVSDPEEVFASDVDVVLVITDAASHGEITRAALGAGKHVVCEKPFAATRKEGEALVELAHDRGKHLLAAPFVQLAPTFRALWTELDDGAIGTIHSARALYGVAPPDWNTWMFEEGPLGDLGIYNLKSLTAILGPVAEVTAMEATVRNPRIVAGMEVAAAMPDVVHLTMRHRSGALSSIVASWEIHGYRRPALELYGTNGTADLLGDDWDPRGYEVFRADLGLWQERDTLDPTWLWTDGLRELVLALVEGRAPRHEPQQDLHLLDVMEAARAASIDRTTVTVDSSFPPLDLRLEISGAKRHLHDHTRSPEEQ